MPAPTVPTMPAPATRASAMSQHPAALPARRQPAPGVPAPRSAALLLPTTEDAERLARLRHPLSVSVLLATTPAELMRPHDQAALHALLRDALRRLEDERTAFGYSAAEIDAVRGGLGSCLAVATASSTDRGLAILVSPHAAHLHHLRVAPRDRVVVDPTFATRDLVRSAAEDPPFLMLVLDARSARLFHYGQRYSRPVLDHGFPMVRADEDSRPRGRRGRQRADRERTRAFLRSVEEGLSARAAGRPGSPEPVVLIASDRMAAEFQEVSGRRRIAAVVRTGHTQAPIAELERMARAALTQHVADRAAAALDTVRRRLAHGRAVAGLPAAWEALRHAEPEVLVVEHSHAPAARLSDAVLEFVPEPEEPGVLDDAVDELIEAALARGAHVVTVPDGALAREGRVVLAFAGRVPMVSAAGAATATVGAAHREPAMVG